RPILPGAGWLLLVGFVLAAAWLGDINSPATDDVRLFGRAVRPIRVWQCLYAAGFVGYGLLLLSFPRRPIRTRTILLAAVLLRLPLLFVPPNTDCNRYIWEGRLQRLGYSPYVYAPDDPALRPLRDDVWPGINKKYYPTIYPPLSELEFRFLATAHYSVKSPQVAHTLFDMGVVLALAWLLMMLGQPAWYLAIYALCPMVLAAFAHAGHNDALMILGILGCVAAGLRERWGWAGLALGLAVLAKTTPIILLPLLVRRSWRAGLIAGATILLGYLVYADAGRHVFDVLWRFPQAASFNNLFDEIRRWINRTHGRVMLLSTRNYLAMGILGCVVAYRFWRPRDLLSDVRSVLALVVLLLPIIHFWYLTWPLALIALRPRGWWSWVLLTGTIVAYWQADWAGQVGLPWRLPLWATACVWAPFFAAWIAESVWMRRRRPAEGVALAAPDPGPGRDSTAS
ncbi:MAG: glycosyltransferase 87 family protein, partial [Phycisphaerae bacterium]